MWKHLLLLILPPYNLAKAFAYTRALESECERLRGRILELEEERKADVNYILSLRGAPPLTSVQKPEKEPLMPQKPKGLAALRRGYERSALMKMAATDQPHLVPDDMTERAKAFAEKVKATG